MKKCPRCGKEYSDTTTLCPTDGAALEAAGDPLIGEILAGKYRVDERLSVGGMGTVYRGTHILMDKKVAIKVLRPSLAADATIVARFSREARAASRISHPHALSVTDFGEAQGGVVFLVMEFLDGRTLKEVIRREGPLPLSRVVEIVRQVGDALDAAHAEGVIHRDLKSENIMLLSATTSDYAKVLDFGIAKIKEPVGGADPDLTSPDLIIGTPQYMSPEQCSQARELDARSDVYSLGVILYEMLVGRVPFTGESPTAIMLKHLQEPPPSVLAARKDLPGGVGIVVERALAKRPEDRYQRAGELVEDLIIAAGADLVQPQPKGRSAARIVVPTEAAEGAEDEETLVRPRTVPVTPPITQTQAPPPAAGLNPWRIIIPSATALLVVFGMIFAFTRNSRPGLNTNQQGQASSLSADPNGQPVQVASPATGRGEEGIPAGGTIPSNANANANVAVSPAPADNVNAVVNENDNRSANANANRAAETQTPRATPEASPRPTNPPLPSSASPTPMVKPSGTPPPPAQ